MNLRWKIAQFFESLWWRTYMWGKDQDKYITWKEQYWKAFLQKAGIEGRSTDRILEVGSGPAGIFIAFPQNEVTAVEPLFEKYKLDFRHLQNGKYNNVRFVCSQLETLELPGKYDLVFCLNVINHVADLKSCLDKIHQGIAWSGTAIITVDAHNWSLMKRLFRLIPGDILHPHQHGLNDYRSLLRNAGFVISCEKCLDKGFIFNYYLLKCQLSTM